LQEDIRQDLGVTDKEMYLKERLGSDERMAESTRVGTLIMATLL
jgi:hypothetical protein